MEMLEKLSELDLYKSVLAESAKALNELRYAKADIEKAISRERFTILMMNTLIDRCHKGD